MEPEYPLSQMKRRPNPFAEPLKKQVTISLGIEVIEYFEKMAQQEGLSEMPRLYIHGFSGSRVAAQTGLNIPRLPVVE
ncbi:hypothetical protein SPLC1_S040470 [Arthrospira platensis C1]|nr:hypothetical protein [Limnospira indica]EKD11050.1 hypothetical protein SPLC1_S040470 [Arthrospira platensis C1]QNH60443.1 MAG: hypothetical protein H2674_06300 [Limnospira indica BM01]